MKIRFRMTFCKKLRGGRVEELHLWCTKEQLVDAFYRALEMGYASYSARSR
ncbi:MAG: hypothetical protein ACLGSA_12675 [Acidobacteriota bacterium]